MFVGNTPSSVTSLGSHRYHVSKQFLAFHGSLALCWEANKPRAEVKCHIEIIYRLVSLACLASSLMKTALTSTVVIARAILIPDRITNQFYSFGLR